MRKILLILIVFYTTIFPQSGSLKFVVKPYIQNMSTSGVMVLWETNINSLGEVKFGKAEYNKNLPELNEKAAQSISSSMHVVELKNLEAGTKYFYQVVTYTDNGDTLKYETLPFMTFPKEKQPFTFAVFGDSQQQDDTLAWNRISNMALIERPNFGLIVGDLVEEGDKAYMWRDQFLSKAHDFMKSISLFPVMGNHDNEDPNYFKYMKSNSPKSYYTVTYGNTQFFIIDSNLELEPGSPQYIWLEEELAKSKSVWKIAAHHHPVYSSDEDDYGNTNTSLALKGEPLFNPIIPLYEKYDVDLVFYGHIHSYERTYPILDNQVNKDGVIYIQTGGAGGNLEKAGIIRNWFTAKIKSAHHYCLVSINENELNFNAIDYKGNLFDYMSIEKKDKDISTVTAPIISSYGDKFINSISVEIKDFNESSDIRYTLDNSTPTINSNLYNGRLEFKGNTILKAVSFVEGIGSKLSSIAFTKVEGEESLDIKPGEKGLKYKYYIGDSWLYLPDFSKLQENKSGVVEDLLIESIKEQGNQFGITYEGYVKIENNGVYEFSVFSDDGTKLYIDDKLIVNNDGSHSPRRKSGSIGLLKGFHKFYLEYFDDSEGELLEVWYKSENMPKQLIPAAVFYH